jgi:hypothetical protein
MGAKTGRFNLQKTTQMDSLACADLENKSDRGIREREEILGLEEREYVK